MKIPKVVKVAGRTYSVVFPHTFDDSSQLLNGQCDWDRQTIKITDRDAFGAKRHQQDIEHTLMHEIIHAIDRSYCQTAIGTSEQGEDLINGLAEGLLQVLRDNKLDFSK